MDLRFDEALLVLTSERHKDFYARMATCLPRREVSWIPYMGVTITDGAYELLYNPKNLKLLSLEMFVFILHHEMVHIENRHLPRGIRAYAIAKNRSDLHKDVFDRTSGYAADMAVNGQIATYDAEAPFVVKVLAAPECPPIMPPKDTLQAADYEFYLELLHRPLDDLVEEYKGAKTWLEAHAGWSIVNTRSKGSEDTQGNEDIGIGLETLSAEQLTNLADNLAEERNSLISQAAEMQRRSHGTVPANIEAELERLSRGPTIDWKSLTQNLLKTRVIETKERSVQRPRRQPFTPSFMLPGRVHKKSFTAVFCMDTSGSVSNKELEEAFYLLRDFVGTDEDMALFAIQADTEVHKEWQVKPGEKYTKVYGRGGTDFNEALLATRKYDPDIVLYYSDGYASTPNRENLPRCPLVWLLCQGRNDYANLADTGRVIYTK